jgi:uridine phosphorylase
MEFHIRCNPDDIARYVFVPGDHARARLIADHFDNARLVSDSRGYLVYTGAVDGIPMTVASTGMGGPTVAICLEELAHMGADTFIRIGSCGALQDNIDCGDVIISTGTYRAGGTGRLYLPLEFPAVPDFWVTTALVEAARDLNLKAHIGLGTAGDAFYAKRDPAFRTVLKEAGIVSGEMESDTIYVMAALRHWRTGGVYASDGTSRETKPEWGEEAFRRGEKNAIRIGIEAMRRIAHADTQ